MPHRRHTRTVIGMHRVAVWLAFLIAVSGLVLLVGGAAPGVGWSLVVLASGLGAAALSAGEGGRSAR